MVKSDAERARARKEAILRAQRIRLRMETGGRKLSDAPTEALSSHLELVRLTRMGGPEAVRAAGGGAYLKAWEDLVLMELRRRQLTLDV